MCVDPMPFLFMLFLPDCIELTAAPVITADITDSLKIAVDIRCDTILVVELHMCAVQYAAAYLFDVLDVVSAVECY